jgi:hypothetical protein
LDAYTVGGGGRANSDAMTDSFDLDRLLRRFLAGDLPKGSLTQAFAAEHARLATELTVLATRRGELLRLAQPSLADCETRLDLAERANYDERFVAAREALGQAAQARRNLGRALAAEDDRLAATEELELLITAHGLDAFRSWPVLRIPRRLLERAAQLLESGAYAKAGFQARLARRLVARLATQSDAGHGELLRRLLRLDGNRGGTPDGVPWVAAIRSVVERGATILGGWLVDDLENRVMADVLDYPPGGFRSPVALGVRERLGQALVDTEAQGTLLRARLTEATRALTATSLAEAVVPQNDPGGPK